MPFHDLAGIEIPSVTAEQLREVDRIAVENVQLGIPPMIDNAGRDLAEGAMKNWGDPDSIAVVLAGPGGNGGDGQ
ncbi:MAG: hypothetical protein A2Z14_19785 [Chloroflexi bacterium RBG_16_48_8]|nr:MAG: hypothetical protein A2Z14_19785 [Chloroflexi bacterium RBG_16_48_8]